jgi:transposase
LRAKLKGEEARKAGSPETKDWLEGRRLRAWELAEAGWKQKVIAEALGVSEGAVSQWMKRAHEGGREALQRQKAPGAASKLTAEQLTKLPEVLARGAEAYGYRGKVWTYERLAAVRPMARMSSNPFSLKAQPKDCACSSYLLMRPNSIPKRGSGIT